MSYAQAKRGRKIATNLSVRAEIVMEARGLGLNLSEVFEDALCESIRREKEKTWRERNRRAISDYNERIERGGLFADRWRKF